MITLRGNRHTMKILNFSRSRFFDLRDETIAICRVAKLRVHHRGSRVKGDVGGSKDLFAFKTTEARLPGKPREGELPSRFSTTRRLASLHYQEHLRVSTGRGNKGEHRAVNDFRVGALVAIKGNGQQS